MISVIIPVYNTVDYLDECIQSVVSQTYKELEIILIDDCSTDGSAEKLDNWTERDTRIIVIHKKKNSGVSDSRNIGLRTSRGEYISFVDSDDWIEPDFYEKMLYWIEKTESDIAFCGYNRIEANGKQPVLLRGDTGSTVSIEQALLQCMPQRGEGKYNLFLWDKLFRKSIISVEGIIPEFKYDFNYGEDVLWVIEVMLKCQKVVLCNEALYNYRACRDGNTWSSMKQLNNMMYCENAVRANKAIWKLLRDTGSYAENNAYQRVLYYQRYAFRTADKLDDKNAYTQYRKDYYKGLLRWFVHNRTITGFKWLVRQIGSDILFLKNR